MSMTFYPGSFVQPKKTSPHYWKNADQDHLKQNQEVGIVIEQEYFNHIA